MSDYLPNNFFINDNAIYIISYEDFEGNNIYSHYWKIGSSNNVLNRLISYKTCSPFRYKVEKVYIIENNPFIEDNIPIDSVAHILDDFIQKSIDDLNNDEIYRTHKYNRKNNVYQNNKLIKKEDFLNIGGLEWYKTDNIYNLISLIDDILISLNVKYNSILTKDIHEKISEYSKNKNIIDSIYYSIDFPEKPKEPKYTKLMNKNKYMNKIKNKISYLKCNEEMKCNEELSIPCDYKSTGDISIIKLKIEEEYKKIKDMKNKLLTRRSLIETKDEYIKRRKCIEKNVGDFLNKKPDYFTSNETMLEVRYNDLIKKYNFFKEDTNKHINACPGAEDDEREKEEDKPKLPPISRFHQMKIKNKIVNTIDKFILNIKNKRQMSKKSIKQFLIAAIPRSGKSYIMAYIIEALFLLKKDFYKNILIITTYPTETINGYIEALSNAVILHNVKIMTYKDIKVTDIDFTNFKTKNHIYIVSKHTLFQNNKPIDNFLKKFDVAFTDEFHHGGSTNLVLSKINDLNGPIIHLTGTYHKVESKYTIDEKQIYYWEYSDVQLCKYFKDINELYEKYGKKNVNSYIKKYKKEYNMTPELLKKMYSLFPDMRYYSIHNDETLIKPRELFILNKNKDNFASDKIKKLLENIIDLNNENSIFNKIKNQKGRTLNKSTGIICFLPSVIDGIDNVSKIFEKHILTKYGDIYETIVLNSKNDNKKKITKDGKIGLDVALIKKFEQVKKNNKHLIIIVKDMLEAGISLPFVDIVLKLHDSDSYSKNYQQNLRSSTESKSDYKPYAYVVDYNYNNIFRVLLESLNTKESKRLSTKEIIKKIVEYKLIVSEDINYSNMENAIEKIENLEFNFNYTSEKIIINEKKFEEFNYNWKLDIIKDNNNKTDVAKLQKEIHGKRSNIFNLINPDKSKNKKKTKTETDLKKDFLKNMKLYTLFFSKLIDYICFLNENDNLKFEKINGLLKYMIKNEKYMKFIKKFFSNNFIKNKIDNLENFKETFKDIIIPDMKNLIIDYNNINNNYINIYSKKMSSILSIEDKIKFIHNLLNPTELTQKERGEVFTAFELITEILSVLDKKIDSIPNDVWSNSKKKWLDLASGLGNFQLKIYQRLMNELKKEFPDDNVREKHILENMIYYCEYSPLNTNIYKKIIDPENKYKLNIFTGDSLSKDFDNHLKNVWKVDYFDFIVGNPPYQEISEDGNVKHGKKNYYMEFIKSSIKKLKKNGFSLLITPTSWMTVTSEVYPLMVKNNHMIYLNNKKEIKDKYFKKVGSTFSYYLIKKTKDIKETEIDNYNKFKFKLNNLNFTPNIINKYTLSLNKKILSLENQQKSTMVRKDGLEIKERVTEKNKEFKYPQRIKNNLTEYSKIPHEYQEVPKILLFRSGYLSPQYSTEGVGGNIMIKKVKDKEEGLKLVNIWNSKLYKMMIKINKFSGYNNQQLLKKLDYDFTNLKKTDDSDIYKFFKLTLDEIKYINNNYNN